MVFISPFCIEMAFAASLMVKYPDIMKKKSTIRYAFCHRIHISLGTVNSEGATYIKNELFLFNQLKDLAQMFCGSCKSGYFCCGMVSPSFAKSNSF